MRRLVRVFTLGTSAIALAVAANEAAEAQQSPGVESVVVTGSRVITNGNNSPTPVTIASTEELLATHPTTVFEALTDLPVFANSISALTSPKGGSGSPPNVSVLNLRDIGAARSLVLYDGHRVPTTTQTGLVDVSTIPQMLLQRVDVVTGGASAVYGSDAIAGVINFITDRKFDGVKANFQYGISTHADDPSYRIGIAGGMDVFGGRGHIEGSVEGRNSAGIQQKARPAVQRYTMSGSGTAALPFFLAENVLNSSASYGGKILGPANNPLINQEFSSNGVLTPFVNGSTKGLSGVNQIGGSGFRNTESALQARQINTQAYGRFDFDVSENVHFYATVSATRQHSIGLNTTTNTTVVPTLSATNAFLPAQYQAVFLAAAKVTTFTFGKAWTADQIPAQSATFNTGSLYINTGFEGTLFSDYKWEGSFTHGLTTLHSTANVDLNQGKFLAALDAVKDSAGNIVCQVSTTAFSSLYPGCVPLNAFGPTATTKAMANYIIDPRTYLGQTTMDDFSGSVTGSPFSTWAGPVNMAIAGEWRKMSYKFQSNSPTSISPLDCTGLRFCTAGLAQFIPNSVAPRSRVTQDVGEAALEADVPVIKDWGFIDAANLNLAARYAEYSTTGAIIDPGPATTTTFSALTWKVGLDVHIGDQVTLRSSRSRDIRAPNLNDLFAPASIRNNPTNDLLTGQTSRADIRSGGNPLLTPEKADTTTAGIVMLPGFFPGFSLALDYFNIDIKNSITTVDGTSASIQNACYLSSGSSFYCSTQTRALNSYTNTSAANAVTAWFQEPLNIAEQTTEGVDIEANYHTDVYGRQFAVRLLGTYQPSNNLAQPNANTLYSAGVTDPVWRMTGFVHYSLTDAFSIDWQTRWRSAEKNADPRYFVVAPGYLRVAPASYSDLNLSYRVETDTMGTATLYLNTQNVLNQGPAVTSGFVNGDDPIGRYFHIGVRYQY